MKNFRSGCALLLCVLVFNFGFTQEGPDPPSLPGEKIFEDWNRSVVTVSTILQLENGEEINYGGGAGVFRDENGHVLTNNHVVKVEGDAIRKFKFDFEKGTIEEESVKISEYRYEVVLNHLNRKFSATLVSWSPDTDLALLKVNGVQGADYYLGKSGDYNKVRVGQTVYVIGFPMRIPNSTTKGIVSKLHWRVGIVPVEDYIQVDAAVNRGNSGGALFNDKGELIGIINSKNFAASGIAWAVPINLFNLERFLKSGEIKRLVLGVDAALDNPPRWGTRDKPRLKDLAYLQSLTGLEADNDLDTLTNLYKATWDNYAILSEIQKGSPAEKSKLFKRGDLIVRAGGREVRSGMDLRTALWGWDPAKPFEIEILRFSGNDTVKIKISAKFWSVPPVTQPNSPGVRPEDPQRGSEPSPSVPKPQNKKERNKWS